MADADDLLTVNEACAELGIGRWSFYQLIKKGLLTKVKQPSQVTGLVNAHGTRVYKWEVEKIKADRKKLVQEGQPQ